MSLPLPHQEPEQGALHGRETFGRILPHRVRLRLLDSGGAMRSEKQREVLLTCSPYSVQMEVAGPLAMFARPDTGGTPTSYPVPTWSACKGMFESIAFLASGDATFHPTAVAVCRRVGEKGGRVRMQRYTTNYGGPLRKLDQVKGGTNFQFFATVLSDVCFRLHAEIRGGHSRGCNPKHYLMNLFNRRLLRQGRCHRTPCLGWSEFTCSYWGAFREDVTEVDEALTHEIPSMLVSVWDQPVNGRYDNYRSEAFVQNARIDRGVLKFHEPVSSATTAGGPGDAQ